jgi:hypothetical protein
MEQLISEYWGPILAAGILAGFLLAGRRGWKRAEAECGEPGCICGGERARAYREMRLAAPQSQPQYQYQQQSVYVPQQQPIYMQAPQPIYIQVPQPEIRYLPTQQPIYLQSPPQSPPMYLPAPQDQRPAPQAIYTPYPQAQAPQSYYAGPPPIVEEYQPEVYYLPAQQPVGQLPPARASAIDEARRRFERERDEMKRRR